MKTLISHRQKPPARSLALVLLSTALVQPGMTFGQVALPSTSAGSDTEVIDAWRTANPGAPVPSLRSDGKGTRLDWTGSASMDRYENRVSSGSGSAGTPLVSGQHYRATATGDMRLSHPNGAVDYLQFNALHTNDPAILPGRNHQIGTLQLGRTGPGYALAAGDVAPNFSSLSSSLGLRGLLGQAEMGPMAMSAYAGQLTESWESWQHRDLRQQPLRSVRGLKLEYPLTAATRAYVTTQGYRDHPASAPAFAESAESSSQNHSIGLTYRAGAVSLNVETAISSWENGGLDDRSAHATVIDGTWRGEKLAFRFGAHDVGAGYTSLSLMVRPGISETYAAADWTLSTWLSLSGDVRRSRQTLLATAFTPAYEIDTDAVTLGANFNFGPDWPGWSGNLQGAHSVARSVDDQRQLNHSLNGGLSYASAPWNLTLGYGRGKVSNSAAPGQDSDSQQLTWTIRRALMEGSASTGGWTGAVSSNGKAQIQTMADGATVKNGDVAVQLSFERAARGSVNLGLTAGSISPGIGLPSARSRGIQLDATYLPSKTSSIKVYWRHIRLNANYADLAVTEKTAGVQLNASF